MRYRQCYVAAGPLHVGCRAPPGKVPECDKNHLCHRSQSRDSGLAQKPRWVGGYCINSSRPQSISARDASSHLVGEGSGALARRSWIGVPPDDRLGAPLAVVRRPPSQPSPTRGKGLSKHVGSAVRSVCDGRENGDTGCIPVTSAQCGNLRGVGGLLPGPGPLSGAGPIC